MIFILPKTGLQNKFFRDVPGASQEPNQGLLFDLKVRVEEL